MNKKVLNKVIIGILLIIFTILSAIVINNYIHNKKVIENTVSKESMTQMEIIDTNMISGELKNWVNSCTDEKSVTTIDGNSYVFIKSINEITINNICLVRLKSTETENIIDYFIVNKGVNSNSTDTPNNNLGLIVKIANNTNNIKLNLINEKDL